jgi:hypothetical protein
MPHVYTEDRLVEPPAIGLFAELGWQTALERLNPALPPEAITAAKILPPFHSAIPFIAPRI